MRIDTADKDKLLEEGAAFLSSQLGTLSRLPALKLEELAPASVALVIIDMVNGFAREGAMSSPRVGQLVSPIAALASRCAALGIKICAFADTHTSDSVELESYPPHCLRGTAEAMVCEEIAGAAPCHIIAKNSTNGFLEPDFETWMRENPGVDTYILTGDCTDICVMQFALTLKAWHNTRNRALRILIPVSLVETYDAPGHPAEPLNCFALYAMQAAGAELFSAAE